MMKIGVVDVGGGLRGIYAAGVFDYCMDENIKFDCCIGVSAGSANVASYLSGQRGRNYKFYTEYALRNQYMGVGNLLKRGSYIDLDYVYGTLCRDDGENPYDYEAMMQNPAECILSHRRQYPERQSILPRRTCTATITGYLWRPPAYRGSTVRTTLTGLNITTALLGTRCRCRRPLIWGATVLW